MYPFKSSKVTSRATVFIMKLSLNLHVNIHVHWHRSLAKLLIVLTSWWDKKCHVLHTVSVWNISSFCGVVMQILLSNSLFVNVDDFWHVDSMSRLAKMTFNHWQKTPSDSIVLLSLILQYLVSVPLRMFRVWAFMGMLGQVSVCKDAKKVSSYLFKSRWALRKHRTLSYVIHLVKRHAFNTIASGSIQKYN